MYSVPHLSNVPAAEDSNEITLETLINQVQTLKKRCDKLENDIQDLKCRCGTYENLLERNRQEILKIYRLQDAIDTNYNGESFDLA